MKKLYLLVIFCLVTIITASAQPRKFYFLYLEGHENEPMSSWFQVDTDKMVCLWDGDSDGTTLMKNYKKEGNKEIFDIYPTDHNEIIESMELITTDEKITVTRIYPSGDKVGPIVIGDEKARDAYFKKIRGEESGNDSSVGGIGDAKNKVVGGVKNAFNKTKDVFKKKDK